MARIRTIKPEFFTDEEVGELAPLDRLFFIGLWCHADKAGRLKDKPRQLKVQILPYDRYNVDEGLAKLIEMRFLVRYSVDGESYLQIRTWDTHQRPHHTERDSTYPACSNGELTVNQPLTNFESEEGKEGKGKEGKGKEGEGNGDSSAPLADAKQDSEYTFPVVGVDEKEWTLSQAKLSEYRGAYPGLNVDSEIIRARQWCRNNEKRRKTPRGMPKFLNGWLDRAQNSGRTASKADPRGTVDAMQGYLEEPQ